MLDLASLTDNFIRNELEKFDRDNRQDVEIVHAIGDGKMEWADREAQLRNWLAIMGVIRFFPAKTREKIVTQILEYADGSRPSGPLGSKAAILSEYEKLRQRIQSAVGLGQGASKPRGVTSLSSKALWCCYPHDVPMFDAHANKALQVISRLCWLAPAPSQIPYARYVDVWLQLYDKLKPFIDQADLKGYPYRIRVLDKLLWHLGSPGFGEPAVDAPRTLLE